MNHLGITSLMLAMLAINLHIFAVMLVLRRIAKALEKIANKE